MAFCRERFLRRTSLTVSFSPSTNHSNVDATGYAARLPSGHVAVIVLNEHAVQNIEVSLDFRSGRTGAVETKTLHAPALDSREAPITRSPEAGRLQDGKYTVTVPHATGVCLTLRG